MTAEHGIPMTTPYFIALAGKGSTGKSTLVPFIVNYLRDRPETRRLLVVDADPHESAARLLGIAGHTTLGQLRSRYERELRTGAGLGHGDTREAFAERQMGEQGLARCNGFDFLGLGHWDLPGSNCVPNRVLARALDHLAAGYDTVLMDNEAGIEHIGRYTTPIDLLLLLATPERLALDVAAQILARCREVGREIRQTRLVFNRLLPLDLAGELRALAGPVVGAPAAAFLPESPGLRSLSRASGAVNVLKALPVVDVWRLELTQALPRLLARPSHEVTRAACCA